MIRQLNARLTLALCGIFALAIARAETPLVANGSAVFSQLHEEYYYATLFVEQSSEDQQVLLEQQQRMEFTILVDTWSKRQFLQHWMQAVFISNTEAAQNSADKALDAFAKAIKGELLKGDKFVIERHADKHASVYLNGSRLMHTSNVDFYPLLLNCWLGNKPPSMEFKQALLGTTLLSPASIASYESLPVSAHRKQQIKSWVAPKRKPPPPRVVAPTVEQPEIEVAVTEVALTPAQVVGNNIAASQALEANTAIGDDIIGDNINVDNINGETHPVETNIDATVETIASRSAIPAVPPSSQQEAGSTGSSNPEPSPEAASSPESAVSNNDEKSQNPTNQTAVEAVEAVEATVPDPPASVENPDSELDSSQESGTATTQSDSNTSANVTSAEYDDYYANLISKTYGQVRYPRSAIRSEQQGKVVLRVRVNRSGSIDEVSFEEKSKYRVLNTAANKAVERAAPFYAVPGEIPDSNLEFLVPIEFKLTES